MEFKFTERMIAALAAAETAGNSASAIARLTKEFGDAEARWAVTQWELRRRAAEKFGRAREMLFTRPGLEMSTHEVVATYHASLFPDGYLVADLTTGIGADLIALANRGLVVGYELDPEHAAYARHNLQIHDFDGEVIQANSVSEKLFADYIFADPARRKEGRKLSAEEYSPPLDKLIEIAKVAKGAVIKLTPMLRDEVIDEFGGDREFVSFGGECRELLLRFPGESSTHAVHIESGSQLQQEELYESVDEPEKFFYEADPAAIRAHCLGNFEMSALGDSNGYLTSEQLVDSVWLTRYEVLWSGSWRAKAVREVMAKNGWKPSAVKKRGVDVEPTRVMKELRGLTGEGVILAIYPNGAKACVAILRK